MPGTVNLLKTYTTVNSALSPDLARGMCFRGDPNIYLAVISGTLLALNKSTGAVVFANSANDLQWQVLYDPVTSQFYGSSAGTGGPSTVARFDSTGTLIDNPSTGDNPYGQIIVNGKYFTGDTGDNFVTVLDAASGSPLTSIDSTTFGPTTGTGRIVYDGTSLWTSAGATALLLQFNAAAMTLTNIYNLSGQGITRFGGLVVVGSNLWLSDFFGSRLVKMDLAGNVIATYMAVALGHPGPLSFDGTYFWLLDFGGGLSVYDAAGTFQALTTVAGSSQDLANDPAEGPGFAWATSGGPPFQVQRFQFVPKAPPSSGKWVGTTVSPGGANNIFGGS